MWQHQRLQLSLTILYVPLLKNPDETGWNPSSRFLTIRSCPFNQMAAIDLQRTMSAPVQLKRTGVLPVTG
jgi:hypothetical protein